MNNYLLSILSLSLLFCLQIQFIECKLVYVIEQYRHGARIPLVPYVYGFDKMNSQTSLTKVGMQQHYKLGVQNRVKYIQAQQFLDERYNKNQIKIISTQSERTIMSAMSHIFGMYSDIFGENQSLNQNINDIQNLRQIQDIIVKEQSFVDITADQKSNYLFQFFDQCNNLRQERFQLYQTPNYQNYENQLQKKFPQLLENLQNITNDSQLQFKSLNKLRDNLECLIYEGVQIPKEFTPLILKQLYHVAELQDFYMIRSENVYNYHNSKIMNYFLKKLDKAVKGVNKEKWLQISSHDTNLYLILPYLNITSIECLEQRFQNNKLNENQNCGGWPQFASNLIIELHEIEKKFYIQIIYNGEYQKLCNTISHICLYQTWKNLFLKKLIDDEKIDSFC